MIAAPLLLLTSTVAFTVSAGEGLNEDMIGGAVLVYAMIAFALTVVVLTQQVSRTYPRAGTALLITGVAGCAAGAGFGVDSMHADLPGGGPLEDIGGLTGLLALYPPGAVFPLAFAGIGIALFLAKPTARRQGALLTLAASLFPVPRVLDIEALAILADLVFIAALTPLGLAALRSQEQLITTAHAKPSAQQT